MLRLSSLRDRIATWMGELAGSALLSFLLSRDPVPAARPRVTRSGHSYYPPTYAKWRKASADEVAVYDGPSIPTGPIFVCIENVCPLPKTVKRDYPRGDVDNFAKGPLDVFTKAEKFWTDDDQVVGLLVFKRYAKKGETPGTRVSWVPLEV